MRKSDGSGHQLWRFITCVPKHQTLVAGATYAVGPVHALADILGLTIEADLDLALVRIDPGLCIPVARFS